MRHSATSSGPAARWIAPSTPPPPSSEVFAALTIASQSSVVMSATTMSSTVAPTSAERSGGLPWTDFISCRALSPLGGRLGNHVDRAALADVVEMRVEEVACGAPPAVAQQLEEIIVGRQLAVGGQLLEHVAERDAVQVD